jgi:hypothetical protein
MIKLLAQNMHRQKNMVGDGLAARRIGELFYVRGGIGIQYPGPICNRFSTGVGITYSQRKGQFEASAEDSALLLQLISDQI